MTDYATPADVVRRVSEVTGTPVHEIVGDAPTADDARMMVVWIARAVMRRKEWSWREIGLSINRPSERTRTIARSAGGKRMRDAIWRKVAYQIAHEVLPAATPTARTGTRLMLNREASRRQERAARLEAPCAVVAVPSPPPEKPKPVSETSKHAPPVYSDVFDSWGFQNQNGQGYQDQYRRLVEQNERFAEAMRNAGYAQYIVGPAGERLPVEAA